MSRFTLPTLIVLLTCVLLTALLPFLAASLSASHDPLANTQLKLVSHSEFIEEAAATSRAHALEHAAAEKTQPDHQHGHSALDHTHQPLFGSPDHALAFQESEIQCPPACDVMRHSADLAALERPPKTPTA